MLKLKIINKPKMIKMKCNIEFPDVVLANLQEKEVIPTKEKQEIVADHPYDGLSKVIVKGYVPKVENKTITQNGVYSAEEEGLDGYDIVKVETRGGDIPDNAKIILSNYDENGYPTKAVVAETNYNKARYLFRNDSYYGGIFANLEEIVMNNEWTTIPEYMCHYCTKLKTINIPNSITIFENYCFYNCNLLELSELPSGTTKIGNYCFGFCTPITISTLPNTITSLGSDCFRRTGVTISELPSGVANIPSGCFRDCKNMTEITCLGAISVISGWSFNGCTNLEKLVISNNTTVPKLQNTNAFNGTKIASGTGYIYVPDDLVESFKTATNWSAYADQIKGVSELV